MTALAAKLPTMEKVPATAGATLQSILQVGLQAVCKSILQVGLWSVSNVGHAIAEPASLVAMLVKRCRPPCPRAAFRNRRPTFSWRTPPATLAFDGNETA
jgi:hypothetical protein